MLCYVLLIPMKQISKFDWTSTIPTFAHAMHILTIPKQSKAVDVNLFCFFSRYWIFSTFIFTINSLLVELNNYNNYLLTSYNTTNTTVIIHFDLDYKILNYKNSLLRLTLWQWQVNWDVFEHLLQFHFFFFVCFLFEQKKKKQNTKK